MSAVGDGKTPDRGAVKAFANVLGKLNKLCSTGPRRRAIYGQMSDLPLTLRSMAKRQTRRSVSLNRSNYEAAKQEAARRGVSLSALAESGLAAIGVPVVARPQQTAERARSNVDRRPLCERQVLGDLVADAYGVQ